MIKDKTQFFIGLFFGWEALVIGDYTWDAMVELRPISFWDILAGFVCASIAYHLVRNGVRGVRHSVWNIEPTTRELVFLLAATMFFLVIGPVGMAAAAYPADTAAQIASMWLVVGCFITSFPMLSVLIHAYHRTYPQEIDRVVASKTPTRPKNDHPYGFNDIPG